MCELRTFVTYFIRFCSKLNDFQVGNIMTSELDTAMLEASVPVCIYFSILVLSVSDLIICGFRCRDHRMIGAVKGHLKIRIRVDRVRANGAGNE